MKIKLFGLLCMFVIMSGCTTTNTNPTTTNTMLRFQYGIGTNGKFGPGMGINGINFIQF